MIVHAEVQLYIVCLNCPDGKWRADQLSIGQSTVWSCEICHNYSDIKRISASDFEVVPRGRKETPVTVTLQSATEPKIVLKLNSWKYDCYHKDTKEEYEEHLRYFYNEHTCPTNWTREIVEIISDGDHDPHGIFEFVSVVEGHLVDSMYYEQMVPDGSEKG